MAEIQSILEGFILIGIAGIIGSLMIHIVDTISAPGYVPKKERLRRKALSESQVNKKHGKHSSKRK